MQNKNNFEKFMQIAIEQAKKAKELDEVPVGAVIVKDGKIIAKGKNKKNYKNNSLYHAELIALNKAMKKFNDWHLYDCDLYVTLEPCPMCAGACINARLGRIIFGAYDPKAGCCGSIYNLPEDKRFNHRPEIIGGIKEKECAEILSNYFKDKRKSKKENNAN